jgi:hypothetical protein
MNVMHKIVKIRFLVYFFIFSHFIGCLYQVKRSNYDDESTFFNKVNDLCYQQEVNIVTNDSNNYFGNKFTISDTTATFVDHDSGSEKIILTKNIKLISFKSFSSGLFESAAAGSIAGVGLGLFLGQFAESFFSRRPEIPGIIYIPITGIIGAIIGITIMGINGYEIQIKFN